MLPKWSEEEATVGIGTMIVFIATVLVAAIAAGVLISTSSDLQQKSKETGQEATKQVSSNVAVVQMIGKRDASTDAALADLEVYITLAPGAQTVDLGETRLFLTDGTARYILSYSATAPSATQFSATAIRDADSSFSATTPAMTSGDLVMLSMELDTVGLSIEPRDILDVRIVPEIGESQSKSIRTAGSYGNDVIIPF